MRTTVRLDPDLLKQAKRHALETERTFTQLVEDALRGAMRKKEPPLRRKKLVLPTFNSGGPLPGVNLDNTAELYDIMDGIK